MERNSSSRLIPAWVVALAGLMVLSIWALLYVLVTRVPAIREFTIDPAHPAAVQPVTSASSTAAPSGMQVATTAPSIPAPPTAPPESGAGGATPLLPPPTATTPPAPTATKGTAKPQPPTATKAAATPQPPTATKAVPTPQPPTATKGATTVPPTASPFPKASQQIAFVSDRTGQNQIWTMDTSGGNLKQLTKAGDNEWPSWSPDNSRIAFSSNRDGNWELYVMNADGSNQTRLTYRPDTLDLGPEWSPDGRIIFNHGMEIYTVGPDGGNPQKIDFVGLLEGTPIYSSDGMKLSWGAYVSDNQKDVQKSNVYGSGVATIAGFPDTADRPTDWRGGKMLFVASPSTGPGAAWLMDDDGSNLKQIGWNVYTRARFSADGKKLVQDAGTSFQQSDIWIGCTDFSCGGTNITNSPGYDGMPDWSN